MSDFSFTPPLPPLPTDKIASPNSVTLDAGFLLNEHIRISRIYSWNLIVLLALIATGFLSGWTDSGFEGVGAPFAVIAVMHLIYVFLITPVGFGLYFHRRGNALLTVRWLSVLTAILFYIFPFYILWRSKSKLKRQGVDVGLFEWSLKNSKQTKINSCFYIHRDDQTEGPFDIE